MASAEPEASPMRATKPVATRRSLQDAVTAPRCFEAIPAPWRRAAMWGKPARMLARVFAEAWRGLRVMEATQTQSGATGVT